MVESPGDGRTNGPAPRRSPGRAALRLAVIAFATYAAVAIVLFVLQRYLIYYPTAEYEALPTDVGLSYEEVAFQAVDGTPLTGWFVPHRAPTATVLFFHGNAGNISHRVHTLNVLHGLGFAVLIVDYRGFGKSGGKPAEAGLYRDADAAWAYLTGHRGLPASGIVLMGRSLGGAVAIDLATRQTPGALVVESTFTSMPDVARVHYPWLPVKMLLRERYDSIGKIPGVGCPVLILHGSDDELIPISLGQALFAAAGDPKQFIETPGGHNDAGFTHSPDYARMARQFIEESLPR